MPNLMNAMMELRKCCIHPYLIRGAEDVIVNEVGAVDAGQQYNCLIQASGKVRPRPERRVNAHAGRACAVREHTGFAQHPRLAHATVPGRRARRLMSIAPRPSTRARS